MDLDMDSHEIIKFLDHNYFSGRSGLDFSTIKGTYYPGDIFVIFWPSGKVYLWLRAGDKSVYSLNMPLWSCLSNVSQMDFWTVTANGGFANNKRLFYTQIQCLLDTREFHLNLLNKGLSELEKLWVPISRKIYDETFKGVGAQPEI